MEIQEVVAALDESEVGRRAAITAARIAAHAGARLIILRVMPAPEPAPSGRLQDALKRSVWPSLLHEPHPASTEFAVAYGLPGIEISRFAEERRAGLLVLGRNTRSQFRRLLLGDTADAVARRSQIPSLFVPPGTETLTRVLVALDGTERGLTVAGVANDFTRAVGARLRAVTVEPARPDDPPLLARQLLDGKSAKLEQTLDRLQITEPAGCNGWDELGQAPGARPLRIRRGDDVVGEILAEVAVSRADVLVVGYHRGGPPGVLEVGSVARRLAHEAPCAVLTVPL